MTKEDGTSICSNDASNESSSEESRDGKDRHNCSSRANFTILQSRNVVLVNSSGSGSYDGNQQGLQPSAVENWIALCSSMDLIAIRNSLESIIIYRTLSWQRLLVVGPSDLVAAVSVNKSSSSSSNSNSRNHSSSTKPTSNSSSFPIMDLDSIILETATSTSALKTTAENQHQQETTSNNRTEGITCITWSPDGRALAVGLQNGQALLFTIEGGIRLVYATAIATFPSKVSSTLEPCPPPPPMTPPSSTSTILTRSRAAAIRRQQLLVSRQSTQNANPNNKEEKVIEKQSTLIAQHGLLSESLDPQVIGLCWAKRISYNYPKCLLYPQEQEGYEAWA